MKIIECNQGSEEWHRARAGCITASMFEIARSRTGGLDPKQQAYVDAVRDGHSEAVAMQKAGYKQTPKADSVRRALLGEKVGDFSEAARNYAFRLAIERISGEPLDEGFQTWQMKRGNDLEPEARMEHEMQSGLFVQKAGFVTSDDGWFGASADGLVDPDGGCEYKCFLAPEKLRAFHIDADITSVIDQVQGGMWITGRKWWHIGLYCPALEPAGKQLWWRQFERDDAYISNLKADLLEFKAMVVNYENTLRAEAA
ncbi:lambda exonuclease family protein [Halomonas sp. MS1]|nr:lambda exonuclease family protein [Halomonas sp. MS1]UTD55914.1 YqaJ viral recombinase family protein [Halomonas sp. MS1]